MSIHMQDENKRNDSEFKDGALQWLKEGNLCRLLDGRRTTGYIETIFEQSAMFRWRITQFEDKGKYWDLPFNAVNSFQFELQVEPIPPEKVAHYEALEASFSKVLHIIRTLNHYEETQKELALFEHEAMAYIQKQTGEISGFDLEHFTVNETLFDVFESYMASHDLIKEELRTQMLLVLNPDSGEWMKGLKIVLAEMGLTSYKGMIPRTADIFEGRNSKENRKKYLLHRLAFLRACYRYFGHEEVPLFRGMATESEYTRVERSLVSCTFDCKVAQSFSGFEPVCPYRNGYVVKMTVPVDQLFMTYNETRAMSQQYKEAEAVIFYNDHFHF